MARKAKTTKETFSRYDSADYLKSDTAIAEYLQAALEDCDDDPAAIAHALGVVARARGMIQLAKDTGLTREALYRALSNEGNPTLATVLKVVRALGMKLTLKAA